MQPENVPMKQCLLYRGGQPKSCHQVAWIPAEMATVGNALRFPGDERNWYVSSVYSTILSAGALVRSDALRRSFAKVLSAPS